MIIIQEKAVGFQEKRRIEAQEIGFDFDGVIADIGEAFIRLACEQYNHCSLTLDEITSFHVETCTSIPLQTVQNIFAMILEDSLAAGLLPLEGATQTLSCLTQRSQVTIITARTLMNPVSDWLDNYLPRSICNNIRIYAMGNHDDKVRFIEQHNLRYFVDDRAETCHQVAEAGFSPLLFRQPWNRSCDNFATVTSWQEIAGLIK